MTKPVIDRLNLLQEKCFLPSMCSFLCVVHCRSREVLAMGATSPLRVWVYLISPEIMSWFSVQSRGVEGARLDSNPSFLCGPFVVVSVPKPGLTLLGPHVTVAHWLLCQWDFPGKDTGVGYHFLLPGIVPTQGSNLHLPHWQVCSLPLSHQGSPGVPSLRLSFLFVKRRSPE